MNDIVIYPSKGKMATLSFGSLALAAMCGSMVVFQKEMEVPDGVMVVGVLGALILGFGFFWALFRLVNPVPSVIVNREGITDNASATSVGLIRWEEISQVTVFRMNGLTHLGIITVDPESVFQRQSSIKASTLRASFKLTQVPISIPQSTLPVSAEDLAQQIIAYRQSLPVAAPAPRPGFAPAAPSAAPAPPAAPVARCAACGASSQATQFCPSCGQPMTVKTKCAKCGATLKPRTKFCPGCGDKV